MKVKRNKLKEKPSPISSIFIYTIVAEADVREQYYNAYEH